MSRFGSNLNQIKDDLPCRFQIFLSGMLGIGRNSYISSFPLGKKRGEKIDWLSLHFSWLLNSPYACLRQTSKFHHQVSFSKHKVAKFCINEFPGQYSWKEYPRIKSANAKNFAFKRGLVVKFARLTQSRIRAITVKPGQAYPPRIH